MYHLGQQKQCRNVSKVLVTFIENINFIKLLVQKMTFVKKIIIYHFTVGAIISATLAQYEHCQTAIKN